MARRNEQGGRCACCAKSLVFLVFGVMALLVYKGYQGAELPFAVAGEHGSKVDKNAEKAPKQIDFQMHTQLAYSHKFSDEHECVAGRVRNPLPSSLHGPFNFTSQVRTNLKTLFMGDFQTLLLSEGFQEATGVAHEEVQVLKRTGFRREPTLTIGTTDDLGVVAAYRSHDMLSHQGEGSKTGWTHEEVELLLEYEMPWNKPLGFFDVLVFKPPQVDGAESIEAVTKESLAQTLEVASAQFGITTVVLMTMTMHKDYETEPVLAALREKNELIRAFARDFEPSDDYPTVDHVLVLNIDKLTDAAMMENAAYIGLDVNDVDDEYLFERLNEGKSKPAVAQVCSEPKKQGRGHEVCKANMLSVDGVFWCMETIGGRMLSGLACSLQCVTGKHSHEDEADCSKDCNDQFMGLDAIDESTYNIGE